METIKRITNRMADQERGSALLVTLMVIVGLSLLGLGFVAVSETESAISINERNHAQTLASAEAAALVVVDWFQSPKWANQKGLLPSNIDDFKVEREVLLPSGVTYKGRYKPNTATDLLFDLPFKPNAQDRLYGDENHPDVLIDYKTTKGKEFLDTFNDKLFKKVVIDSKDYYEGGKIIEIRAYAPTIVDGVVNAKGFYEKGDRYGVATVKVTAEKTRPGSDQVIARRVVKLALTEFPFPGPNGPIQSASSIAVTGSFEVYWGEISAHDSITLKITGAGASGVQGFPWADAKNRVNFEHGYDSSTTWKGNTVYKLRDVVHPTKAKRDADPALKNFSFEVTTAGTSSGSEPLWNSASAIGTTYTDGGVTWTQRAATMWPNYAEDTTGTPPRNRDVYNWMQSFIGRQFEDMWAQARTRKLITNTSSTTPLPNYYTDPTVNPADLANENDPTTYFNWFQKQTKNEAPDYKQVDFPNIVYEFWKQIALAGDGQEGINYFKWMANSAKGPLYARRSAPSIQKTVGEWANAHSTSGTATPGFFFFDTVDGSDPQLTATPKLTDEISFPAATPICMKGFIYLNSKNLNTSGNPKGEDSLYAYPGELFRDVGILKVDTATKEFLREASGALKQPVNDQINKWDYQDVDGDKSFDLVLKNIKGEINPATNAAFAVDTWVPVPYNEKCGKAGKIGLQGDPDGCSEPHEPYLNIKWPASGTNYVASPSPTTSTIGWYPPGSEVRYSFEKTSAGGAYDCSVAANDKVCTSNKYDETGALTRLSAASGCNDGPILDGVLYNEGTYDGQGNPCYYGSLLIKQLVELKGTPTVYFDESLLRGDFKEKFPNFPRVYISAHETDDQNEE